jgi:hypothetical protein
MARWPCSRQRIGVVARKCSSDVPDCRNGYRRLAHNLTRWLMRLGDELPEIVTTKTIRMRYISLPGRLASSGRRRSLHLPTYWQRRRSKCCSPQ